MYACVCLVCGSVCHVIFSMCVCLVEVNTSKYGLVMAIYPIGCEAMATRRKKFWFSFHSNWQWTDDFDDDII